MEIRSIDMYCSRCGGAVRPHELKLSSAKSLLVFGRCMGCGDQQSANFLLVDLWERCPVPKGAVATENVMAERIMEADLNEDDRRMMKDFGFSIEEGEDYAQ